jgi:phage gpG-like protein
LANQSTVNVVFDHFPQVIQALDPLNLKALRILAIKVLGRTKMLAPRDTGLLANSYEWQMVGNDTAIVGTNVIYAPYQEFGTQHQPGTQHLRPAFEVELTPAKVKAVYQEVFAELV